MRIKISNLGPLRQAEFDLGDLTIICGRNNTGKTYATYALYGFLRFWKEAYTIRVPQDRARALLDEGTIHLDLKEYVENSNDIVANACHEYAHQLPGVLASKPKHLVDTTFAVELTEEVQPLAEFDRSLGTAKQEILRIQRERDESTIEISLLVEKGATRFSERALQHAIGNALQDVIFGRIFPNAVIASAERTGAAIFRRELDFARNRLLEQIGSGARVLSPFELLNKVYSAYPLPVRRNVDFARQLEDVAKGESFIARQHQELLDDFGDIIGGEYKVKGDALFYVPKTARQVRLTMTESSSCVRSLLDIGFYLRHAAQQGDLVMVDEPELNLHPENQRRIARLFARLVNLGIRVFITTHSDYIVKELNTLIMLNRDQPHLDRIRQEEGYRQDELLPAEKVKVHIAGKASIRLDGRTRRSKVMTFVAADIDPELGIEVKSFDDTIETMNRVQKAILFGGE